MLSAAPAEDVVIEGYQLIRLLGQGGSGTVYKARQQSTGQIVALKLLRRSAEQDVKRDQRLAERFERGMGARRAPGLHGGRPGVLRSVCASGGACRTACKGSSYRHRRVARLADDVSVAGVAHHASLRPNRIPAARNRSFPGPGLPQHGARHHRRWRPARVAGGTLCYTKACWSRWPFPDLQVGEDNAFIWNGAKRVAVNGDSRCYVATVHAGNTSPKQTSGKRWTELPVQEIEAIIAA